MMDKKIQRDYFEFEKKKIAKASYLKGLHLLYYI